ncbi:hypothetical protein ACFL6Y_10325 [Elusimicrobiota bacterium]
MLKAEFKFSSNIKVNSPHTRKLLLTSICRPLGTEYGDAPSVGYEVLYGQVTRLQGAFSPRGIQTNYALDYIAHNLEVPTAVLQYPSKRELVRELKKGYELVGISFIIATFHRMKEVSALIRKHSPQSKIILGGYGTILDDDTLKPYGDYFCRSEGVAFMRNLLGEPALTMPYKHPLIESKLKVFSTAKTTTGIILGGLGCPNGCDFCCTSHYFKRQHIKLLPTGKDIHNVIDRYLKRNPEMVFSIIDEDFLLNKKRAMEFRDCVLKGGKTLSIFAFSSIKAISQYGTQEILEMGIDGIWIGYEGTRSGYNKQQGRSADELFLDLRKNGIAVLSSMIVGFDYQTPEIISQELNGLLKLKPALAQFLIYGPTPGTPFYARAVSDGLLRTEYVSDPEKYYHDATGFAPLVNHPTMSPSDIESEQTRCFKEDFNKLGPSIYRFMRTGLLGYKAWRNSTSDYLKQKARWQKKLLRNYFPAFLAGRLLGPNQSVRKHIRELESDFYREIGLPNIKDRLLSILVLCAAAWTWMALRFRIFQHPRLIRNTFRIPQEGIWPAQIWESLENYSQDCSIQVDLNYFKKQVWVKIEGALDEMTTENLSAKMDDLLKRGKGRLVLDLEKLQLPESRGLTSLARRLQIYRRRIRIRLPDAIPAHATELLLLAEIFKSYEA